MLDHKGRMELEMDLQLILWSGRGQQGDRMKQWESKEEEMSWKNYMVLNQWMVIHYPFVILFFWVYHPKTICFCCTIDSYLADVWAHWRICFLYCWTGGWSGGKLWVGPHAPFPSPPPRLPCESARLPDWPISSQLWRKQREKEGKVGNAGVKSLQAFKGHTLLVR